MEEKKEIKVRLSTVVFLLIILALLVALGVVYYLGFVKDDNANNVIANGEETEKNNISVNEQVPETNNNVEENVEESKEVGKIDKNKELIYSAYNKYANEYSYSIPKININSQDVIAINSEIEKLITETKTGIEDESFWYVNIGYKTYINGDILSLVIDKNTGYDYTDYVVYNVNMKTGKKYSNEELIILKGYSTNEFLNKLPELYKKQYMGEYITEEQLNSSIHSVPYNKTISKENYSINEPMFLDDNGNVNIVAKIYKAAGGTAPYSEIIVVK